MLTCELIIAVMQHFRPGILVLKLVVSSSRQTVTDQSSATSVKLAPEEKMMYETVCTEKEKTGGKAAVVVTCDRCGKVFSRHAYVVS